MQQQRDREFEVRTGIARTEDMTYAPSDIAEIERRMLGKRWYELMRKQAKK